ncbi:MAG TPA: hypothetical protein VMF68_00895 [Spirochaetia bacterium]|nr:hypothetical protein [Spirochaetia bacterium]
MSAAADRPPARPTARLTARPAADAWIRRRLPLLLAALAAAPAFSAPRYVSVLYGFTIDFPAGWNVSEPFRSSGGGTEVVRASSPGAVIQAEVEDRYSSSWSASQRATLTRGDFDVYANRDKTIGELADGFVEGLQKSLSDVRVVQTAEIDFDGARALDMRCTGTSRDGAPVDLVVLLRMLTRNGLTYRVIARCNASSYPGLAPTLSRTLDSLDVAHTLPASERPGANAPNVDFWNGVVLPFLRKAWRFLVGILPLAGTVWRLVVGKRDRDGLGQA